MHLPALTQDLTRRHFVQAAALSALPVLMPGFAKGAEMTGDIDAHVHVWTPDTTAYPLAPGFEKSSMKPLSFTPDELFAECRPVGVNRIVLIQMSFYQYDNRYMLEAIAKYPDVFRGVAVINHDASDACDVMRKLAGQGVTGFRLYANAKAVESWSQSEAMQKMWKCAAETKQAICLLANPDALPGIHQMCKQHPETKVVVDHFGRVGIDGTIRSSDLDNLCRLAEFPKLFVKTSAFYALGQKQPPYLDLAPMIRRLRDTFGAARLMWASDCPFQVQNEHSYAASISLIRDRLDFLTPDDKTWILRKTAEQVYWS
ncbi:amidohydrolase family protein [Planctomicrobium piriforme]|uniref:D-galactarolactone isomerase n=1 Tax=Planctomicrobium piriforme TaxID=1576369 RepID=A0A1I3INE3_9PLAN|nr:amidohydrolase family protein [Planctomicrobium piriforme]SFI49498.1 D-galactarolactone isomerase [Planctomicrobium piriforme]